MTEIDPQTVRDFARRAILSAADEVDYLGIGEQFSDEEGWPDEESAYDAMLAAVDAERKKATVTVTWPDEQDGLSVEQLTARVAELESGRNQLRHVVNDQAHRIQAGLDRIAELETELKDAKAIGEQCTATTGRRLTVQCGREAGHDDAHTAEVGGGRISWHGDTAGSAT